jgi:hypothetical protein
MLAFTARRATKLHMDVISSLTCRSQQAHVVLYDCTMRMFLGKC